MKTHDKHGVSENVDPVLNPEAYTIPDDQLLDPAFSQLNVLAESVVSLTDWIDLVLCRAEAMMSEVEKRPSEQQQQILTNWILFLSEIWDRFQELVPMIESFGAYQGRLNQLFDKLVEPPQ